MSLMTCTCDVVCDLLRGDLRLHEDEDEHEQGRKDAGRHHPDGELPVGAQRVYYPATLLWARHAKPVRHAQLLWFKRRTTTET